MTPWFIMVSAAAAACTSPPAPEGNPMPTSIAPRDGNIAIQEELDAARRAGTIEAYDLFIARHPHHRLAAIARAERERIARTRRD
jgi:hypothetical protein